MAAKTQTGLDKNTAAALSYVLGPFTGIVFLILERDPFVRFHAMQSIVVFAILFVVQWIVTFVPVLGLIANGLISLLAIALWVILMVKAYQGEVFKLPFAGGIAEKNS